MIRFSKLAAAIAVLPMFVFASTAHAVGVGQIEQGDIYRAKNITTNSSFADNISAVCGDTVAFRVRVHNGGPATLTNVKVAATLNEASSTSHGSQVSVSADNNLHNATVTANAGVQTSAATTASYANGSTQLLNYSITPGGESVLRNLPDGILSGGVNIGDIGPLTSDTEEVQFQAKLSCTPPTCLPGQTGTPPNCVTPPTPSVVCDALAAEFIGSTNVPAKLKFTAKGTAKDGATINGYAFDFGDGANADSQAASVDHTYAKAGDYKATVQVKSSLGVTAVSQSCAVMIKVTEEKPPVVTPPVTPPSTPGVPTVPGSTPTTPTALPSTGPEAAFSGILGTSALGFGVRQFIGSRRRLSDLLS